MLAVSVTALLASAPSSAAMSDVPGPSLAPPAPAPSSNSLQWVVQAGGISGGHGDIGGLALGTMFLVRQSRLLYGANFEGGGLFGTRFAGAADAGIALRSDNGFGLDLMGAVGLHRYHGVGRGFLSPDPGTSATLPFAGARARGLYEIGRGKVRLQLGVSATLERDLSKSTQTYSYGSDDTKTGTQTVTRTIGFTSTGLMLDLGGAFEL